MLDMYAVEDIIAFALLFAGYMLPALFFVFAEKMGWDMRAKPGQLLLLWLFFLGPASAYIVLLLGYALIPGFPFTFLDPPTPR